MEKFILQSNKDNQKKTREESIKEYNNGRMSDEVLPVTKKAVELVENKGNALDLGAGALRESKYMTQQGFEHVTAVDKVCEQEWYEDIDKNVIEYVEASAETFDFEEEKYDLINATFVFPFVDKKNYRA